MLNHYIFFRVHSLHGTTLRSSILVKNTEDLSVALSQIQSYLPEPRPHIPDNINVYFGSGDRISKEEFKNFVLNRVHEILKSSETFDFTAHTGSCHHNATSYTIVCTSNISSYVKMTNTSDIVPDVYPDINSALRSLCMETIDLKVHVTNSSNIEYDIVLKSFEFVDYGFCNTDLPLTVTYKLHLTSYRTVIEPYNF